ncbi:MAG: cobyric acid synthase CobQ [Burkholderiales bacterium]|nr:cobyric acid synthase CobQ [Burkholderiales bacterium]
MTAVCVMVLGTTSGAGKSLLTTALCRHYARMGLKVAPFKAQNMSNNARVVRGMPAADGHALTGEIGSAQYFQALAAGVEPEVRMNPLLLKPEADTRSQVVLMGKVDRRLSDMPWRDRSETVWPYITAALDALCADHDVVVIEGAGSPAEINLHTWALLPAEEQALIFGFVLNKFRGDAALLAPAPEMLQNLTGIPVVATLPMWWRHGLPEEDGVFDDRSRSSGRVHTTVAVVAYPRLSNLDEFQPLKNVPGVHLVWARTPADCVGADWIILPGSKATVADLGWLRQQGLDKTVAAHAARGGAVLGICGGLQMLGEDLMDTDGMETMPPSKTPGLGLLPLVTEFVADKTVCRTTATLGEVTGVWSALSGVLFGTSVPTLERVFDGLADLLGSHVVPGLLDKLIHRD